MPVCLESDKEEAKNIDNGEWNKTHMSYHNLGDAYSHNRFEVSLVKKIYTKIFLGGPAKNDWAKSSSSLFLYYKKAEKKSLISNF